jgi:hypothetical protein
VVEHIKGYLLANYTYDENVPAARYPLEAFLFSQRRGYCQQFSGAMALMLRMDGIPARIGAGFKPVVYDSSDGTWRVRALDAHAWVEVFFSGIGWVSFDPTPAARGGGSDPVLAAPVSKAQLLGHGKHASRRSSHGASHSSAGLARGSRGWGIVAIVAVVLAGLLACALALALLLGRLRLRRCLGGDGAGAVAELHRVLDEDAGAAPAMTLSRLEAQLHDEHRDAAGGYVAALRELRYAEGAARPTARGRAALRRALAAHRGPRGRMRLLSRMPPGVARRPSP